MKLRNSLTLLAVLCAGWAAASMPRETLRIGFTESAFRHTNRNDTQAAFKVFAQTVGRQRGYEIEAVVEVYPGEQELLVAGRSNRIDIAWCDAWNFAVARPAERLQPAFFSTYDNTNSTRIYRLYVRRGGPIASLADLRSRSVLEFPVAATETARRWVDSLLLSAGLPRSPAYFSSYSTAPKSSAAVLPVFFGAKDACVVDDASFGVLRELNPQVGDGLTELAHSEPLAGAVVCLATNGWSSTKFEQDLREAIRDLHQNAEGRQILTLFRCGALAPYRDAGLDTLRTLHRTVQADLPPETAR